MGKISKRYFFKKVIFIMFIYLAFHPKVLFAFEKIVIIPAEKPEGVTINLEKGEYIAKIEGGAIALFYPINPNYQWLVGVAVGTDVQGGQDEPNLGTLYFEPYPRVYSQAEAERKALEATEESQEGTYLRFFLEKNKEVRFWVSDFDYTDNSGMVKLKIRSISE